MVISIFSLRHPVMLKNNIVSGNSRMKPSLGECKYIKFNEFGMKKVNFWEYTWDIVMDKR